MSITITPTSGAVSPVRGRPRKYPLPDMGIGDSFEVSDCLYATLYRSICNYRKDLCRVKKTCPTFVITRLDKAKPDDESKLSLRGRFRVTRTK